MSETRWEDVKRIVDQAIGTPHPEERRRFLETACEGDKDLRREVESLLRFEDGSVSTETTTKLRGSSGPSPSGARFQPGTVLSSRYRIIERVGKGGMGEIYHAEDLALDQAIALKFLPPETASDRYARERFRSEVRLARQIAHPNVCRVYDLGEADGLSFISMEYIRGEDLRTLLRRIGRLPPERGTEIAVQLASGLAAAHAQGVLHRDLKPANVMLDEQGHVRITDFGIAAIAGDIESRDILSGTPAYMAPEQLRGKSVTERSDLYSMGLVLYELFTGRPAFKEPPDPRRETRPAPPSSLVEGLDPAVERVIVQCLEPDPARRPVSAAAVREALPGGDRLAAAVARGETPARALVAEAGVSTGFSPAVAWICLVIVVLGLAGIFWFGKRIRLSSLVPLPKSPEILTADARRILTDLDYETPLRDHTYGFVRDSRYIDHLMTEERSNDWLQRLSRSDPGLIRFWYRESPVSLVPRRLTEFFPAEHDPPVSVPGMLRLRLDTQGRLRELQAVPRQADDGRNDRAAPNWLSLFDSAGFDPDEFVPVEPHLHPTVVYDNRAAWEGVYPDAPEIPIRLEAAALDGKIVDFKIVEPWTEQVSELYESGPARSDVVPSGAARVAHVGFNVLLILVLSWLALRNLRSGRGDRQLAVRLALALAALVLAQWLLAAHHVAERSQLQVLNGGLYRACYVFVLATLLYLVIEPYARKLWPRTLVSWIRLFSGRFKDPVVGRDVLAGCFFGVVTSLFGRVVRTFPVWLGAVPSRPDYPAHPGELLALRGVREAVAELLAIQVNIVTHVMFLFVALLLFRLIFRKTWAAVAVHWLAYVMVYGSGYGYLGIAFTITVWHVLFFRFGFLSILVGTLFADLLLGLPLIPDLTAWHAYNSMIAFSFCLAVALYGFKVSLAGRPAFRDLLAE
jgi:serine/threonine-protein kinase